MRVGIGVADQLSYDATFPHEEEDTMIRHTVSDKHISTEFPHFLPSRICPLAREQEANGLAERELQDTDRICPPGSLFITNIVL